MLQHTKGEYEITERDPNDPDSWVELVAHRHGDIAPIARFYSGLYKGEQSDNIKLFHEALEVATKFGVTPKQMAEKLNL